MSNTLLNSTDVWSMRPNRAAVPSRRISMQRPGVGVAPRIIQKIFRKTETSPSSPGISNGRHSRDLRAFWAFCFKIRQIAWLSQFGTFAALKIRDGWPRPQVKWSLDVACSPKMEGLDAANFFISLNRRPASSWSSRCLLNFCLRPSACARAEEPILLHVKALEL